MAYALIAVGYSLVFGILRLVNFSHGSVYAFGAHAAMFFIGFQFGLLPATIASMALTGVLGVLIDKVALEPLRKKNSMPVASLITTIGISNIIQNLLVVYFGSERKRFPAVFSFGSITVGGVAITSRQVCIFLVSLILMGILVFIVQKTQVGLAMRATEQNPKAARMMGVDVNKVISFTFFIAGISASIAGVLIGGYYEVVYPTMGYMAGLKAFAAAVLGGIGSLPGAIIGGLIIGVAEAIAAATIGSTYRDCMAFIILIIFLIVKPNGLFGRKQITKV